MSEEKKGFFSRLVEGLTKTRNNIMSGFDAIFSGFSNIDEDFYEELEEVLVMADLGIHTTENIIEELKRKVKEQHIKEPQACKQLLADTIKEQMRVDEEAYQFEHQTSVVLVIGVNGVGKTTTREMVAAALSAGFHVFKTPANHNSQVGVPVTLSEITENDQVGVIELGMSEPGAW